MTLKTENAALNMDPYDLHRRAHTYAQERRNAGDDEGARLVAELSDVAFKRAKAIDDAVFLLGGAL